MKVPARSRVVQIHCWNKEIPLLLDDVNFFSFKMHSVLRDVLVLKLFVMSVVITPPWLFWSNSSCGQCILKQKFKVD